MYDFREGLLLDQSIYKDNTCDWKAAFLYILSMLVCYAWGLGWWYLFYYLYGTYEKIVFWIWIGNIHYSFHHYYYNRSEQPSKWEKKKGAKEKRGARKVRTRKANSKFKKKKNR